MARHCFLILTLFLTTISQSVHSFSVVSKDPGGNFLQRVNQVLRYLKFSRLPKVNEVPPQPVENPIWRGPENVGQISGVTIDLAGKPVIFHRADRTWDYNTFDEDFEYREIYRGRIQQDTILTLNPETGDVDESWGSNIFYLPHGIHVDFQGNVWTTDVALHQVFKFPRGSTEPELILGDRFKPGNDERHFCQPTSVAVTYTGEVVVADGYCNSRILVFDGLGNFLKVIPELGEFISLRIPHSVTVLQNGDVCVADRENMRVVCLDLHLHDESDEDRRSSSLTIQRPDLGRVFAVASYGNFVYAVSGPTSPVIPIRGFTIDPIEEKVIDQWGPLSGTFKNPHSIAVSPNGTSLYVTEIGPNKIWKFDLIHTKRLS